MFGIGTQELLILFLVVLILFGADRIPEVARAVGKGIRDFKRAAGDIETEIQQVTRHKDLLSDKKQDHGKRAPSGLNAGAPAAGAGAAKDNGDPGAESGSQADGAAKDNGDPGAESGSQANGAGESDAADEAPEAKYPGEPTPPKP